MADVIGNRHPHGFGYRATILSCSYLQQQRHKLGFIPPHPIHLPHPSMETCHLSIVCRDRAPNWDQELWRPKGWQSRDALTIKPRACRLCPGISWLNLMWGNKSEQEFVVVSSHWWHMHALFCVSVKRLVCPFCSPCLPVGWSTWWGQRWEGRQRGCPKWPGLYFRKVR